MNDKKNVVLSGVSNRYRGQERPIRHCEPAERKRGGRSNLLHEISFFLALSIMFTFCLLGIARAPEAFAKDKDQETAVTDTVLPQDTEAPVKQIVTPIEPPAVQPSAQATGSQLKRQNIEKKIADKDTAGAIDELIDVVTSGQDNDLHRWAVLELYNTDAGQVGQIISKLEAASAKDPGNDGVQSALAEGYIRARDWAKVVEIYEKQKQKKPDDAILQVRLTDFQILAGQYDKAIARLEPLVQASPNDTYNSDILANAYARAGMKDKAIALYEKKIAAEGASAGLVGRYAQALSDFGMPKEALKQYKKAQAADPSNPLFSQKVVELEGN